MLENRLWLLIQAYAAAASARWLTSVFPYYEADDEIHTAGGENRGQKLNSHVIILNDCFGLMEVPVKAASFSTTNFLGLYIVCNILN